jgi:hypothetical protein
LKKKTPPVRNVIYDGFVRSGGYEDHVFNAISLSEIRITLVYCENADIFEHCQKTVTLLNPSIYDEKLLPG